jgi:hypothetical protein
LPRERHSGDHHFDAAQHGTGIGAAFHISTSRPVVVDIYPYGGGRARLPAQRCASHDLVGDNYVPSALATERRSHPSRYWESSRIRTALP